MATMRPSFWKVSGHSHQQVSNSGWTISPLNSLAMIDAVFSVVPVVDLHAPLQAWEEDDYVPPKWDGEALGRDAKVLEQRLRDEVDLIEPGRPSVLDVNEREKYIVRANDALTGRDVGRAVEVLVDIDASVDERMNATTSAVVSSTLEMQQLEERMVTLA